MSARRISFVNCKGGVGKTTLTINLGASLVKNLGKKVLIVDLDAQSNSSIWLMGLDRWIYLDGTPDKSVSAFFKSGTLKGAIRESVIQAEDGLQKLPGLDIIPATYDLMDLDHHIPPTSALPFYQMFWYQIQPLFEDYDYIIFDCPPSVGRATQCAIYSSQEVYVPCTPDLLSNIGLRLLNERVSAFEQESHEHRHLVKGQGHRLAELRGIILNCYAGNVNASTAIHAMKQRIENLRSNSFVSDDASILPVRIRDAVIASKSAERSLPVVISAPSSPLAEDFEKLARWIDQHPVKGTRKNEPKKKTK